MIRKEVDYYAEIAAELAFVFRANLKKDSYKVCPLIGEVSSALRTLIANGYAAGELLREYANAAYRLHLDISILVEDQDTGQFEIIIFEIKKVKSLGLAELSQLIGYCLVSNASFGVLVNIDTAISSEFSVILDSDKDLTSILRIIDGVAMHHQLGVMVWNSVTKNFEYTNSGAIRSISHLVESILNSLAGKECGEYRT